MTHPAPVFAASVTGLIRCARQVGIPALPGGSVPQVIAQGEAHSFLQQHLQRGSKSVAPIEHVMPSQTPQSGPLHACTFSLSFSN